jgi:hypothetical protein
MEQRQTLPFHKVTTLIAGLFMRRFVNRLASGLRWGKGKQAPGSRTGVGRKAVGNPFSLVAIIVVFIFNTVNISGLAIKTLAAELGPAHDSAGRVEVEPYTYFRLGGIGRPSLYGPASGSRMPNWAAHNYESTLEHIFLRESSAASLGPNTDYAHALVDWYEQKGLDGFVAVQEPSGFVFPRLLTWDDPALRPQFICALGVVLLILAGARHCWTLGSRNQDLGQVEWSTEWLFTLPATSRALFGAQILGHTLVDPFAWVGTIPFLLVVYLSSGVSWVLALPAALGNSLYLGLLMASLRVVSETWLRKRLAPARLKNLQALFTLVGIVLLFLLFALARSQVVSQWVVHLAQHGSSLLVCNPFSLPAACFFLPPAEAAGWELFCAAAIILGSVGLCSFLVRDGLISAPAIYTGERGPGTRRDFLPAGIIGKDLRLLLRDRNFFVQTLVAPGLIVCFQVLFNVGMAQSIGTNFQYAATFAFGVGAYVMISTGLNVLAVEGNALWMLYGLPMALPAIMLRKTLLWSALGVCYACVVLIVCGCFIRSFQAIDLSYALVALAGVLIYSFIASGIGMLATDPLEVEVKRRIRPGMIYLYMILASLYGYALFAPSTWARLGQIVLSALLAYALWQKVRDRAPFLLDAVSMPAPRVSLADGLMAALGFFVLQGVFTIGLLSLRMGLGQVIVMAYAAAGALVVAFTLFIFWRSRVVGFFSAVGLAGPRDGRRVRAVLLGLGLGLAGGAVAFGYLYVLRRFPVPDSLRMRAEEITAVHGWWLVLLAVVAAPLFEEFIFRGLVFRGMRRSLPARWSIAGSAAVFAICHPPISVIPVFIMGVLAATGFELTGWIVTPICIHMTYNGMVLLAGLLPHGK